MESLLLFFVLGIVVFTYIYYQISKKIQLLKTITFKVQLFTNELDENYETIRDYYAVVFKREDTGDQWEKASMLTKDYNSFLSKDQKKLFQKKFESKPNLTDKLISIKNGFKDLKTKRVMFSFKK